MPQWRSREVVQASRIDVIEYDALRCQTRLGLAWDIPTTEYDNKPGRLFIVVHNDWVAKHNPAIGGYFVRHEDGDTSYSSAETFEADYSRQK